MSIINNFAPTLAPVAVNPPIANCDIQVRGREIDQNIKNLKESLTDFKVSLFQKEIRMKFRGEIPPSSIQPNAEQPDAEQRNVEEPDAGQRNTFGMVWDGLETFSENVKTLAQNLLARSFKGARNLATALLVSRPPIIEKALFLAREIAHIEEEIRFLESEIQMTILPPIDLQSKKDELLLIKQEVNKFLVNISDEDLDLYLGISQSFYGSDEAVVSAEQCRELLEVRKKAQSQDLDAPPEDSKGIKHLNRRQAVLRFRREVAKNAGIGVGLCVAVKISVIGVQKAKYFGEKLVESFIKAKDQLIEGATKATGEIVEKADNAYVDLGKKVADGLVGVYISVDENTIVPKIAGVVVGIGLATFAAYKLGVFRRRPDPAAGAV